MCAARRAARDAGDEAARLGPPVRRAQAGQRRNDGDAAASRAPSAPAPRSPAALAMMPRPSRSHCTSAPAMKALPSSAYAVVAGAACRRVQRPGDGGRAARASTDAARRPRSSAGTRPSRRCTWRRPASVQSWPKSAACWSPATPAMGMPSGRPGTPRVSPIRPADGHDLGQHRARGTPNSAHSSSSNAPRRAGRSSSVREALVTSVACVVPAREPPDQEAVDGAERDARPPRRARAGRRRCRAASGSSSPRSTGRGPGRCARAPSRSCPARLERGAQRRRCAGPARRWRWRPAARRRAPTAASSRAGW